MAPSVVSSPDKHWISYFGEPSIGVWEDETYFVAGFEDNGRIRLDIQRKDGLDGIGWDDLQAIKNDCGYADKDAIEFYPRQDKVINNANFRHLYIYTIPLDIEVRS